VRVAPMKLSELLKPEAVLLDLETADKWEALQSITAHLSEQGLLPKEQQEPVRELLAERERSMSTYLEHGVAVPHTSVETLGHEVVGLALSRRGVPFDSVSGEPAQIIVTLITPRSRKLLHIRTLAEVARLLSHATVRKALLESDSAAKVIEEIRRGEMSGLDVA
jgi:PTS system nitrogen regulatory IIA component